MTSGLEAHRRSPRTQPIQIPDHGISLKPNQNKGMLDTDFLREQLGRVGSIGDLDFMRIPSDFGNTANDRSALRMNSLRDEIENSFLSYSSPNSSPRRSRDAAQQSVDPNEDVISGKLELREAANAASGMRVFCSISNKGLLRIFEGKRRTVIAELRLVETVVGYRRSDTRGFILTSNKRFLFDASKSQECLYIHCDEEEQGDWLAAMVKLGAASVEMDGEEEAEAPRGPRGARGTRERGESKSMSPEPRGFLSRFL
ncbi:hypothetical protein GUITHDRAFT_140533 [Guillardia theta CCMP2712]|uniref:PH domain-containing protein n=1 Tax=Guillardia theta (strain CCMP2712) TaxID=905079 RepID=L1J4N6_GUITC|nr:hypothetical protein GUITHDRAFT_140533 [Guillardia theta CCMP2712]EKX43498.1 hypothetical protein GUITHDRAFT_140533 [Guillardia theta CCMP2712]|eukprot:XP_005830478.1 hypothetical protein GUITHDRAFT_140533 [Guillardia theta CCMP2712]